MNLSRWKLLAGVFGLSVCGLAALAEPACRNGVHGEYRQLPPVAESNPTSGAKVSPPPIAVQPPKPQDVKPTPAPAPLPSLPPAIELPKPGEAPKPTELKLPTENPPKPLLSDPVELTLPMIGGEKPKAETLPALPTPGATPKTENPNIPGITAIPDPVLPSATGPNALPLPTPGSTAPVATLPLPLHTPNPTPAPIQALPPSSGLPPPPPGNPGSPPPTKSEMTIPLPVPSTGSATLPPLPPGQSTAGPQPLPSDSSSARGNAGLPLPGPATTPAPLTPPVSGSADLPPPPATNTVRTVESRSPSQVVEKRLKVTLQMGEGNPRFEIRDGEEVVLKVISDKIDVKAPTEKGDLWSTLKASGRVRFQSPGGDGYCDELQIIPGSCEVIATGKVQFKYNWGKVETAVTSERMTFRLGATPETR